jgi:hypothetical protein
VLHSVNLAERAGPSPELACAYATMSVAAGLVQLHALARSYARWALEIARDGDDLPALAFVLVATGAYDFHLGDDSGFRAVRAEDAPKPEGESYPRG